MPVSISGSGVVDSTLTLNPAQWNMPNNVLTITYQWFRAGSAVTGATGVTYDVTAADVGKAITVRATATRPGYKTGTSTSNAITGAPGGRTARDRPGHDHRQRALRLDADADRRRPGTSPGVDHDLPVVPRTSAVVGQTGTTYVVGAADVGKDITVKATGTKAGYANGISVSNAVTRRAEPGAGRHHARSGSPARGAVGSILTMTPPSGTPPGSRRPTSGSGTRRRSAGRPARPTPSLSADVGKSITVKATATKAGYVNGISTSNGILATQAAAVTPTTLPSITGVAAARETLTASTGEWPGSRDQDLRLPVVRQRRGRGQGDRAAPTSSGPATPACPVSVRVTDVDDRLRSPASPPAPRCPSRS